VIIPQSRLEDEDDDEYEDDYGGRSRTPLTFPHPSTTLIYPWTPISFKNCALSLAIAA
jgi:hypothetical protein